MTSDMNPYGSATPAPRESRRMAARRREIYEYGAEVEMMEQVIFAIGQHNMQRATMLLTQAEVLAGNNPARYAVLCDFAVETLHQAKRMQQHLFRDEEDE